MIPLHTAAWVIASVHLGTLVRSRRAWACAGLLLLPALIAWIVAGSYAKATPSGLTTMLGWNALLQVSVPLVSLLMGVAVVAEEAHLRHWHALWAAHARLGAPCAVRARRGATCALPPRSTAARGAHPARSVRSTVHVQRAVP